MKYKTHYRNHLWYLLTHHYQKTATMQSCFWCTAYTCPFWYRCQV